MSLESDALAASMRQHLEHLKMLRGRAARPDDLVAAVKRWQAERLARTYADLAAQPRYRAATEFFLNDLYGPKDFSARDQSMLRILPAMVRLLPASAVETAALAVEVEAVSEDLDHRLADSLPTQTVDESTYAAAYRASATPEERLRQIRLIQEVGLHLDKLVRWPLVFQTLKLMRQPARVAGLTDLQDFLERGFEAFRQMRGAADFLGTIHAREVEILNRLFSGHPEPFSI